MTFGHVDVLRRALKIFDRVIVAVAKNPEKAPLFTLEERVAMIQEVTKGLDGVEVDTFDGLLVRYARAKEAQVLIRGLRALSDFEYEFQMALTNRKLDGSIETIYMMPSETYSYISSRMIKEIAGLGADIKDFVPPSVAAKLMQKLKK